MLDILNVIFIGYNVATMTMYPKVSDPVMLSFADKNQVQLVDFKREWWREDGRNNCTFHGITVSYVRDWEEKVHRGKNSEEITIAAQPDDVAGHALLITSKECDNLPKTPILFGTDLSIRRAVAMPSVDNYMNLDEKDKPKWFNQVIEKIDSAGSKNPEIRKFSEEIHQELDTMRASKQKAASDTPQ